MRPGSWRRWSRRCARKRKGSGTMTTDTTLHRTDEAVEALRFIRTVAAAPEHLFDDLPQRKLVVASEYELLARSWLTSRGLDAEVAHSFGAG